MSSRRKESDSSEAPLKFSCNILSELRIQTSQSKSLNTMDIDHNLLNSTFDIDEFEKIDCSYLKYSGGLHYEKGYVCTTCNPTKNLIMCGFCYRNCHKDCIKLKTDERSILEMFTCYCGEKLKHQKPKLPSSKHFKPCKMLNFDKRVGNKKHYYCPKHNIKICSVCAKECHLNCDNVVTSNDEILGCECTDKTNHNDLNEFTFNFPIEQTKKTPQAIMKDLFPIQILNILFETKIYKKLVMLVRDQIDSAKNGQDKFISPFPRIIGLFTDIFDSKFKTYYYNEEILQLFKYSSLINFIRKINIESIGSKLLKFRLLFLILFIHLKKDFQLIKSLTSIDFISGSLLQRILYKNYITTKSLYTEEILDKYKLLNETHTNYLNSFILKEVSEFMKTCVEDGLSFIEHEYEFEIGLKIISFVLKRMLFTKKEIEKIAEDLHVIQDKLIEDIKASQEENDIEALETLHKLFKIIVELTLLLSVNYNDIVISDYLTSSRKNKFSTDCLDEFIHVKSDAGENIFKMIVKNALIIRNNYNDKIPYKVDSKVVIEFEGVLQLFSIVDNFYYNEIKSITENDLDYFYDYLYKIENSKDSFTDIFREAEEKSEDRESGQVELLNFNKQRVIPLNSSDTILESKMSIEIFLNSYFTASFNKPGEIFYSIHQELEDFLKKINNTMMIKTRDISYNPKSRVKACKTVEEKIQLDYTNKIRVSISKFFYYIQRVPPEQISQFIDIFSFSSFDDTIFKVLMIFSKSRYANQVSYEFLDLSLTFLSFFFLSKKGVCYFLTGKNIVRINKLFNRFRIRKDGKNISLELNRSKQSNLRFTTRILEFLYLVANGIKIFRVQLSGHKVLKRLKDNFIEHLQLFLNQKEKEANKEVHFKIHLNLITSILNFLNGMYNLENLEIIKNEIWDLFKKSNYLTIYTKDKFLENFIQETDDMGRIVNEGEKIIEKFTPIGGSSRGDLISDSSISTPDKVEDPFHTNIISEIDPSKNFELNENLYYNFLKLITQKTYFTYTDNIDEKFKILPSLETLNQFKIQLRSKNLSLKIRRIFLRTLKTFFFSDYLDPYDIKKCETAMTTAEFIEYEKTKKYQQKYEKLRKQEKVMEIFIQELEMFPSQISNFPESIDQIEKYILGLVKATKSFANFYFYSKKIWCKSRVIFYNLVKELSLSMNILKNMYYSIVKECKLTIYKEKDYESKYSMILSRRKFDIMDIQNLYCICTNMVKEIFEGTQATQASSLGIFLKNYDTAKDYNFSPPSFIEKKDFEFFYNEDIEEKNENPLKMKLNTILEFYTDQFSNFESTNFFEIMSGIFDESDQIDYRKEVIEYFIKFFQKKNLDSYKLYPILCIVNKLMFYDKEGAHKDLSSLKENTPESIAFFTTFNETLHKTIVHTYITCKNLSVPDLFLLNSNNLKLLLQFLQLIGEGYNYGFQDKIFNLFRYSTDIVTIKPDSKVEQVRVQKRKKSTLRVLKGRRASMGKVKEKATSEENTTQLAQINELEGDANEMTFYTLTISSLINSYNYLDLTAQMPYEMPYDKLIVLCSNLIEVITAYIDVDEDYIDVVNDNIEKLFSLNVFKCLLLKSDMHNKLRSNLICFMKTNFLSLVISYFQKGTKKEQIRRFTKLLSPSQIFEEILHHMQALFVFLKFPKKLPLVSDSRFVSILLNHYIYNNDFRSSLQLNLCLQYFILIKFYEEIYQITTLKEHINKISKLQDVPKEYYGLNTKFAYKIRLFFEELVLKVDIKRLSKATDDDDEKTVAENIETFFIRPHITYHLSKQTKESFEINVDRTSTSSKLNELLFYSDYFSFEMATNARILGMSLWSQFMKNLNFKHVELLSYFILIIQNLIMIVINYKDTTLPTEEYEEFDDEEVRKRHAENLFLAIFHAIFLFVSLVIWFYYKFPLDYQKYLLRKTGNKFIFKSAETDNEGDDNMQLIKDYFDDTRDVGILSTINKLNSTIPKIQRFKIGIFDAFLNNREICILFYTLIFVIIYISTGLIIWLALPMLFLFNSIPTLYNVYSSVKNHMLALMSIMILIYIFSYNFMWISYHYMSSLFYFELMDISTKEKEEESMCTSPVQCLLHIIQYFVVQQAPDTDYVSFKNSTNFYIINFFYDLVFFLVVSLCLYNVFLGVLYDTFSELRCALQEKENDIRNVCFICQLTRDGSLAKRIDFNDHVRNKHYMWNYVYFMIFLHVSNSNDFDSIQSYVSEKLAVQDNSWIPQEE